MEKQVNETGGLDLELHRLGMKLKLVYSLVGLFLGLSCIISGSVLSLYGATGHTSLIASFLGLSTQLNDAAPGVVIFIVGIFMVLITRFQVKERITTRDPERSIEHVVLYKRR